MTKMQSWLLKVATTIECDTFYTLSLIQAIRDVVTFTCWDVGLGVKALLLTPPCTYVTSDGRRGPGSGGGSEWLLLDVLT